MQPEKSLWQVIWSNPNYRIAIIIAGITAVWLITGLFRGEDTVEEKQAAVAEEKAQQTATTMQVRARHITAQQYSLRVQVKGRTEADRVVEVKAEVTGQIEQLLKEKGAFVKAGETICRLAMEDRELRLAEAAATVAQAQIDYDGAMRLKVGGYQSDTAIANSKARLEAAKATQLRREIDVAKTNIKAPFAGIIDEQTVEVGTLMRVGDNCATVVDLDPLVIAGQVAETDVIRIPAAAVAKVKLLTGEELAGEIRFVSRSADNATRTYRIEAAVPNPQMQLFSGVTAEMQIAVQEVPAHLISAALLMLDDEGNLGVRVLDADNRVQIYSVQVIGDSAQGIWVAGLPAETTLITVGQEYVAKGEIVAVAFEDTEKQALSADL